MNDRDIVTALVAALFAAGRATDPEATWDNIESAPGIVDIAEQIINEVLRRSAE